MPPPTKRSAKKRPAKGHEIGSAAWFFADSSDLFAVIAADGTFLDVNHAWRTATGWSEQELIGRSYPDLLHPESQEGVAVFPTILANRGYTNVRIRLAHKDGHWLWLEGHVRPAPEGCMVVALRQAMGDELSAHQWAQGEQARRLLSEAAGVGLWRYDRRTDYIELSPAWRTWLDAAGVDIDTAEKFNAAVHPKDVEKLAELMLKGGTLGEPGSCVYRVRRRDGRWQWVRIHTRSEYVEDGVYIIHGLSQDVTETAEAISGLTEANRRAETLAQKLNLALSAAKAAVVEVDFTEQRLWLSPQFEDLVGRSMTYEQAAQAAWPFIHPDDIDRLEKNAAAINAGRAHEPVEVRIVRPDGEVRWMRLYGDIVRDEGASYVRANCLLIDIDEPKRQELALIQAERDARSATEAKSNFLANMSHEIRTPLNGVLGVLHLLKGRGLADSDLQLIEEALACGEMLKTVIDDVVDFSKIEAGRLDLQPEAVDPRALLEGVARLLRPQAEDKGLTLQVEAGPLPPRVSTDPVRLRQCLFNLIGNAVKFTLQGGVTVRACVRGQTGAERLRFEIEDTGVGIPAEAQAHIFQRFHQADGSTTRRFGGSGLGLSITQRLAELMGGDVGFHSISGKGSTFWLEVAAPACAVEASPARDAERLIEGLRILLVEDNPTNRLIATKMLEALGAVVEVAEDGERGVEAAALSVFDLILMDIQMPGIDGLEATRRIRKSNTPSAETPIIALTANVLSHQRAAYLAAGMDGVVGKPISPIALFTEIAQIAEGAPRLSEAS